jgi:hypothetical protein
MKALVIGSVGNEAHEASVRQYFLDTASWTCHIAEIGAGTPAGNIVTYQSNVSGCVQYAIDNEYKIIIRSYTGVYSFKLEWDAAVNAGIAVVHAHGSNSNVFLSNPPFLISAITVGGGTTTNVRSYGPGLEIFDATVASETEESWTTAVIAGRLANILDDNPTYNIWDARQHLRQQATLYSNWTQANGYGKATNDVVSELGIAPPLECQATKAGNNGSVTFNWRNFLQTEYVRTRVSKAGTPIYQDTGVSHVWTSDQIGSQNFGLFTETSLLSAEDSYSQFTITGLDVPLGQIGAIQVQRTDGDVTLTLGAVSNATSYRIERFISGWEVVSTQAGLTFQTTVVQGQTTNFRYVALNQFNTTGYSGVVNVLYPIVVIINNPIPDPPPYAPDPILGSIVSVTTNDASALIQIMRVHAKAQIL